MAGPANKTQPHRVKRVRKKYSLFSVRSGIDMPLLMLIFALLGTGLIMLFSASFAYSLYQYGSSTMFISQQATFAVLGIGAMLFISYFDYHHLHKLVLPIGGAVVLMLFAVLVFKGTAIAPVINGANRKQMEYYESMGTNKIQVSAYLWDGSDAFDEVYDYCKSIDMVVGVTPNSWEIGRAHV